MGTVEDVRIAKRTGFCYGVREAIDKAKESAAAGKATATLGQVVHNEGVIRDLQQIGVQSVETLDDVDHGAAVVIRAHGVKPEVFERAESRGVFAMLSAAERSTGFRPERDVYCAGSPSAGTWWLTGGATCGIAASPKPSATREASSPLTRPSRPIIRSRMYGRSTLPSSKRSASTMWSCSGADWLSKKSVACAKCSKNFSERRRRIFGPSIRSAKLT